MFTTHCPHCNTNQSCPDHYEGTNIKCSSCLQPFTASPQTVAATTATLQRYQVKDRKSLLWTSLATGSLSSEVHHGRIGWDWRIRREDEPGEWSVLELAEIQQHNDAPAVEVSDETKSYSPPADALCYLLIAEEQTGPYTPEQIRSMWANGQITAETLYWFDGFSEWFPARNFCASPARAGSTLAQIAGGSRSVSRGLLAVVGLLIGGGLLLAVWSSSKSHAITGYDTKILFVGEGDYSAASDFKDATRSGWEIKSSRRAWTSDPYRHDEKQWGTEYTLQKPLYGK